MLVKYGMNFLVLKVRAAEMYGYAGVLIFSEPEEDGFMRDGVYTQGPWRPESSVHRGSIHYNSIYPGDPLTPGVAALKDAHRIPQN